MSTPQIYAIQCVVNSKCYVGKTKHTVWYDGEEPKSPPLSFVFGPIICSNGMVYTDQLHAEEELKLWKGSISRHIAGNSKHVDGLTFCREGETVPPVPTFTKKAKYAHKAVIRSDGRIFKSMSAAGRELEVGYKEIREACNSRVPINGYFFEWYEPLWLR